MERREDMHQALYRKWRPKSFDEVYGQDHITSILKYEIANSKFSHAYLFCGSRGTGKTTCAKILAKAVNCLSPVNGNPCGKCASCISIESGTETDVLEMDAASNNSVEDIRDIRDEVVYSPSNLKYRVYIIDEVHMLSASAFNALLKTLEEPPEHVVFVLATTELQKLPATIISRCQRFDFRRISTEVLKNHLLRIAESEGIKITDTAALTLAKHAQGGMRDAISLLDLCAGNRTLIDDALVSDVIGIGGREESMRVLRAIADKDHDVLFGIIDETARSSRDIAVFWQELISAYRDLLIVKNSKEPLRYLDLTDTEAETLTAIAKQFSAETLIYHSQMVTDAYISMLRSNSLKRIIAELTLVRMCDSRLSTSPEAMLARITALEKGQGRANVSAQPISIEHETENETEKPRAQRTAARPARKASDDDEFRGDAPSFVAAKPATGKVETPKPTASAIRQLRAYKGRAEATELMDGKDPMLSAFFKRAKWYSDGDGNIVLKFENKFEIDNLKRFSGDAFFIEIISQVEGRSVSAQQIRYECESEKKGDEILDKIIEASEDA